MKTNFPKAETANRWLEQILAERFGHAWHILRSEEGLRLQLAGSNGSIVFDSECVGFTEARSDQPCTLWNAEHEGWESVLGGPLPAPGFAKLPVPLIESFQEKHLVHYDILGLTYWMLTRIEEIGRTDLDHYGRFPAKSSHAFQNNYLGRPVVDEWLHILEQVILHQWPTIKLKQRQFNIAVSHDVDRPSRYGFPNLKFLCRRIVGDIIAPDFKSAVIAPWIRMQTKSQLHPRDPFNTFDWIMDLSEQRGLTSAFYFFAGRTQPEKDAEYEIEHPAIRSLLKKIHRRGHEIGLHPSFNTYKNPNALKNEADRLRKVCSEEQIRQEKWGGRMHYLRWEHPTTLRAWEFAEMSYDSTLSFADHAGFRCGTCIEYPAFDPVSSKTMNLRVRPLIAMECSVMSKEYMGAIKKEDAFMVFQELINACRKVKGQFTLLWHNSELRNEKDKELYKEIINL